MFHGAQPGIAGACAAQFNATTLDQSIGNLAPPAGCTESSHLRPGFLLGLAAGAGANKTGVMRHKLTTRTVEVCPTTLPHTNGKCGIHICLQQQACSPLSLSPAQVQMNGYIVLDGSGAWHGRLAVQFWVGRGRGGGVMGVLAETVPWRVPSHSGRPRCGKQGGAQRQEACPPGRHEADSHAKPKSRAQQGRRGLASRLPVPRGRQAQRAA